MSRWLYFVIGTEHQQSIRLIHGTQNQVSDFSGDTHVMTVCIRLPGYIARYISILIWGDITCYWWGPGSFILSRPFGTKPGFWQVPHKYDICKRIDTIIGRLESSPTVTWKRALVTLVPRYMVTWEACIVARPFDEKHAADQPAIFPLSSFGLRGAPRSHGTKLLRTYSHEALPWNSRCFQDGAETGRKSLKSGVPRHPLPKRWTVTHTA